MAALGKKLRTSGERGLMFYCPACKTSHGVNIGPAGWRWNGRPESPTFEPSLLSVAGDLRCHCFVRDGRIEYLSDSSHDMKAQTVSIPDWPFGSPEPADEVALLARLGHVPILRVTE